MYEQENAVAKANNNEFVEIAEKVAVVVTALVELGDIIKETIKILAKA